MSEEDFVYVPMFRVAGPKDEVTEWLRSNHSDQTKDALKSCYSKDNLKNNSIRKAFEAEVKEAEESRRQTNQVRSEMKQVNLMALVKLMSIYNQEKKTRTDNTDTESNKETRSLKSRLQEIINEKKVLDVTSMKENGTEGKRVGMKSGSLKGRLSQDKNDSFYHVVYNPSSKNSVLGVTNFMKNYGSFTNEQISRITEAVSSGATVNIGRTKSPTRSPLLSPKRNKNMKSKISRANNEDLDELVGEL